ncbi:MAG: ATP-dependent zinc metalloprotease FtsH [Phycisphaerae bacterium]|nr:MAG: ATP-dependent zinc metalloprotease FtsH [Phycisphaerae bacterium]
MGELRTIVSASSEGPNGNGRPARPPEQPRTAGQGLPPGPSRLPFMLLSLGIMGVLMFMLFSGRTGGERITPEQFQTLYQNQHILPGSVVVRDDRVIAKRKPGPDSKEESVVYVPINATSKEATMKVVQEVTGGNYDAQPASPWASILLFFGPVLLMVFLVWFLISRVFRGGAGGAGMLGSFGKSRHKTMNKEMTGITFADVAGIEEAKEEVTEIIEFLRNPKKFTKLGGRIPRGVLLIGDPGCGKTLLAKAIAGEADVPFFSISGSDFVEMFVGVGASRVRDLFKQAKDSAPCIIFLDEIDAVGRRRGSGFVSGGHDEREQTLNAILVEMDGFAPADGVIVIAATNRSDVLDPALTRPGRFDRQVQVPLPDVKGRLEILKVHSKKVKLGPNVDLERIARGTPGFSGADLAAIINEGAIAATMADKEFIEHADLEEARDKVKFGRARKSRKLDAAENLATAYHEAGHAVVQVLSPDADPLHKVTIIPRGNYGGATFSLPEKDRWGYGQKWLRATMAVLCGGRIAEQRATGDIGSGAAMDIAQVTQMARKMVLEWGMSDKLGFVRYEGTDSREMFQPERDYSDQTALLIDAEVRRIVDEAYTQAEKVLNEHWDKVVRVAEALLRYETLTQDDVNRLMRGEELTRPVSVSEQLKAEERRKAAQAVVDQLDAPGDAPAGAVPKPA